ncbi:GNAT family N-acetyltransferase [Cellulomonas fimi]|uniref:GCN5-related N-acetyltransferase n=1 Tax=Cellulomonas fimi (strain ATCC 484 / DSM 20113 / JCM 1341 / CCUG 24087 / LMG 16345 / NBRC 15513 / NCIMB 8980 / NCTC 7547 / NRS-133) TaxID=590998 RepID=F4H5B6_CELFA|nr:GNAT family protein [Cellulomonas fimi]AEE47839.1 GCN5-related N-acetyltransferase [Cellulomonas fimi ATCC 484]NNH06023.1 GNAT family N-acetyltransferase [Cellulomonas fimi]
MSDPDGGDGPCASDAPEDRAAPTAEPGIDVTTPRLHLRPFRAGDATALHAYLSHPDAVRYEPYGVLDPDAAAREAERRAHDPAFVAVSLRSTGTLVGNLYLAGEGPAEWHTWQLGYVFHPAHWGHGYATEACTALLDHVFTVRRAWRVVARCDPRNERSWALLERLGMRREGHHLRAASFTADADGHRVWHDTYVYALLADEWTRPPS